MAIMKSLKTSFTRSVAVIFVLLFFSIWFTLQTLEIPLSLPIVFPAYNAPEIHLDRAAISHEGIGAVLSGLKPVVMLKNHTRAVVTSRDHDSGHGYFIRRYIRLDDPRVFGRVPCELTRSIEQILSDIVQRCERYDWNLLQTYGVFRNCNYIRVEKYLNHPRTCVKHSQNLIRDITKFRVHQREQTDMCVLRRGGDTEETIRNGEGNMWAIDEENTLPLLSKLSELSANIVLSTETDSANVQRLYHANVFSNKEDLDLVVRRLSLCRCLFISGGSSFAAAIVQITQPKYIVYTQERDGFEWNGVAPYNYSEFENAISVLDTAKVMEVCSAQLVSRRKSEEQGMSEEGLKTWKAQTGDQPSDLDSARILVD